MNPVTLRIAEGRDIRTGANTYSLVRVVDNRPEASGFKTKAEAVEWASRTKVSGVGYVVEAAK